MTNALAAAIESALQILTKCVVPLYVDDVHGKPSLIGTGFFIRKASSNVLVTAAHVLDALRAQSGYYDVSPSMKRAITGRVTTNVHAGPRETDNVDLGAVLLEGPGQPPYPEVDKHPLVDRMLQIPPPRVPSSRYAFIGFPESRSRVRHRPKEVRVEPYAYFGDSAPVEDYQKLQLNPALHLCLKFDRKKSFDLRGRGRSFPRPHGVSGSPIFYLYDEETTNQPESFLLAGLVTTWKSREGLVFGAGYRSIHELVTVATSPP